MPEDSSAFVWGYAVQYAEQVGSQARDSSSILKYPKLMLLDTEYTKKDRSQVMSKIGDLITHGTIRRHSNGSQLDARDAEDPVTDFMTEVLRHAKGELEEDEGYFEGCPVHFALTVPVVYSPESLRVMHAALAKAILATGFGELTGGCVDNLVAVPEPEAAAYNLLAWDKDTLVRVFTACADTTNRLGGTHISCFGCRRRYC